jgi:hypothetical protein
MVACRLAYKWKPHLKAFKLYKNELSILCKNRIVSICGNQSSGTIKKNLTMKLNKMCRKNNHTYHLLNTLSMLTKFICIQLGYVSFWLWRDMEEHLGELNKCSAGLKIFTCLSLHD